jgi:hypothetical protein
VNGFDPIARLTAATLEREATARTEETERLAGLFAQALPQALHAPLGLLPQSSESWRRGVGNLTHAEPLTGPVPAVASAGGDDESIVFSLKAGDLGELKCRLERTEAGLRVVIGADGRNALTAAGAERSALESALKAAGLSVREISVVPLAKFGTLPARGGSTADARHVRHPHAGSREERSRRVKLIG